MPIAATHTVELTASVIFAVAIVHTLVAAPITRLADRFPRHAKLFHLLGEVELTFGFWATMLLVAMALMRGGAEASDYLLTRDYTAPLFVVVVMVVAASRPITATVTVLLHRIALLVPLPTSTVAAWLGLTVVPLLGSVLTEPAAMTIAALMLAPTLFRPEWPERAKYLALGALLVNVSIGGVLTAYAAPPVLMVSAVWHWDTAFMLEHFGWRAILAVVVNATIVTFTLRHGLRVEHAAASDARSDVVPLPVVVVHVVLLVGVIVAARHPLALIALLLLFFALARATGRHQGPLVVRQAALVGVFLGGLVILGGMQAWWLQALLSELRPLTLFFGATALTSVTDNAALTYLGSLVAGLSDESKYMLVAGAMAGGGLTVIANAPNPAGVALLRDGFDDASVGSGRLLVGAALPTAIAVGAFLLPWLR